MKILVTGSKGMIGSRVVQGLLDAGHVVIGVDRAGEQFCDGNYYQYTVDLSDIEQLRAVISNNKVDRVIHLAALAHRTGESDLSWERYYQINVKCSENVFTVGYENNAPVLFISTVDVYGFVDGVVSSETIPHPVTNYGKSKYLAEQRLVEIANNFGGRYTIFRFSPVYTETIKRDIQKRYYLKYPNIAYKIGKGQEYEILDINLAIKKMVDWCQEPVVNTVQIIKDSKNMWTPDYIQQEKAEGRAKFVLTVPKWMVSCGYSVIKAIMGKNDKTYFINKAVHPLRSK